MPDLDRLLTPDGRESRLPQWGQDLVKSLRAGIGQLLREHDEMENTRNLALATARKAVMEEGFGKNPEITVLLPDGSELPIPDESTVQFPTARIDVCFMDDAVRVDSHTAKIVIIPLSEFEVLLEAKDR